MPVDTITAPVNMATISRENSAEGVTRTPVQTLDQGDFLNLLVAQMSQQDPMNPQKDTEFIAQMAQFSALEQSKSMMQDMSSLRANALLGNTVTVTDKNNKATGTATGVVSSVVLTKGVPSLMLSKADGTPSGPYDMADLLRIDPTFADAIPTTPSATTN